MTVELALDRLQRCSRDLVLVAEAVRAGNCTHQSEDLALVAAALEALAVRHCCCTERLARVLRRPHLRRAQ